MGPFRRAASVFAREGVSGCFRRVAARLAGPVRKPAAVTEALEPGPDEVAAARHEYDEQVVAFRDRCRQLGHEGLEDYYWYHTIDLGHGLVTPGDYDFRGNLEAFAFPEDLRGKTALDVGSATGFFAFELERRGALVTSVELPSLADWDILSAERDELLGRLAAWLNARSPEEAYQRHLDGPFQFCHRVLGSRVRRCYSTVYDLSPARLGRGAFDFVYAGDLLLHTFAPLKALDALARVCSGTLAVTIDTPVPHPDEPLLRYLGAESASADQRTWWAFSPACVRQMLRRLGFRSASVVGSYQGLARRCWLEFRRAVIHATR
jgi:tRNA (mo5U34)-methyltransferase